jgi:lipoyl(octanoyl) transferase
VVDDPVNPDAPFPDALVAYNLGPISLDAALHFQRQAHYEVTGDRQHGQLLLCEHPAVITMGRQASRAHVLPESAELRSRGWEMRWLSRGGGSVLHLPGQLAIYAVLPLDALRCNVQDYLVRLQSCVLDVVHGFDLSGQARPDSSGVSIDGRLVATLGVAVRDWVTTYGFVLNVCPDLDLLRRVRVGGLTEPCMTSLERERRVPVRMPLARQLLLEAFEQRFGFRRLSLVHRHPAFTAKANPYAVAPRRR